MIVWRTCYLCFLEPHLRPRAPPEDGEGTRADLAFLAWFESLNSVSFLREFIKHSELTVFLLGHPDVRIVTEASLAEDWEVCILPVGPVVRVGRQGHRHPGIWFSLWKKECFSLQCSFSPSFVMIQFWNIYCFSKNLCILDITWRTHYKEQIGHNLYVEIEKMPLNLSSCDQSSPFSSPSPFFSGDALPLFDSWDFDLREKLSDFLFYRGSNFSQSCVILFVKHLDLLESPFSFMGEPDRDLESLLDWNVWNLKVHSCLNGNNSNFQRREREISPFLHLSPYSPPC